MALFKFLLVLLALIAVAYAEMEQSDDLELAEGKRRVHVVTQYYPVYYPVYKEKPVYYPVYQYYPSYNYKSYDHGYKHDYTPKYEAPKYDYDHKY